MNLEYCLSNFNHPSQYSRSRQFDKQTSKFSNLPAQKKFLNGFTFIFLWLTLEFISSWGQLNAPLTQKFMTYFPLLVLCAVLFLCKNWLNVLLSRNLENCSLECRNVGIKLRTELITVLTTFRLTYKL